MTPNRVNPSAFSLPVGGAPAETETTLVGLSQAHGEAVIPIFPIVGIGASAGGLKAVSTLLAEVGTDTGMAFVVIQHLDPVQESHLVTLLRRSTQLPVDEAVDGGAVLPNHVYVITPNTNLRIEQGILRLSVRDPGLRPTFSIDHFLCSLAADQPANAVGVILSGTGTDGTLGIAAIKAAGGITFAQNESAEHSGMPLNAISHGHIDFVLTATEIAKELGKIARFGFPCIPMSNVVPGKDTTQDIFSLPPPEDPEHYALIIGLLHTATGIDFTHYRSTTILRRTMRRMAMIHQATLAEYEAFLSASPDEITALARDILINVTSFYRDPAVFELIKSEVFPALMKDRAADLPIRLWVVGCSTGQEVYSMAIELIEYLAHHPVRPQVQIFATDISDWALAKARLGWYPESLAEEIPPDRLARYFTKEANGFRIVKSIRDLCVFAKHDITADIPFSRIDLISCRNVLIYLGTVLQRRVFASFHVSLKPSGFLLLGSSESLGRAANVFETIDEKNRLYRAMNARSNLMSSLTPLIRTGDPVMPPQPHPIAIPVSDIQRAADKLVLGRFVPAGVLISDNMEIIQYRGRTQPYLEPAQGEASLNLLTMVPFGVAEALRAAISEAKQLNQPVRREHIAHRREEAFREIAFEIIPITLSATNHRSFLVLFQEQDQAALPSANTGSTSALATATVSALTPEQRELIQLRNELAAATVYVQSLVEQNHALAEQLTGAEEESQSTSEEFRSTNEELQTAKEEVESSNEELVTINDELRAANHDLNKASAILRTSGEFTSAIIESMRHSLLVLDAKLRVESANKAFRDDFHVTSQECIGQLVYEMGNGEWNIPELRRLLENILPNHSVFDDFEVTHTFRHIGTRTMLLNARRLSGIDSGPGRIVLVIADVTDQARLNKSLQEVSNELKRSNDELDQFAAVASHDLQEPLRMITSYITLLQHKYEPLFDEKARQYIGFVESGAKRMSAMIKAILVYSQLGHKVTELVVIDSAIAFKNAVIDLKVTIEDAHVKIIQNALPRLHANKVQLTQLFQNLLSNAVKFRSPQRLSVIQVSAAESAGEWTFAVADNGIGMEEKDCGKIFQLFQRVHHDRQVDGCGIGLATCKKIAEHHGGRIWVESKPDVGSTFFFTLPK